jgi:hypothetical protein
MSSWRGQEQFHLLPFAFKKMWLFNEILYPAYDFLQKMKNASLPIMGTQTLL